MGKLKQKSTTPAASKKTSLAEMFPPKKVATQQLATVEPKPAQPLYKYAIKPTPIMWKPTKECKSLIRTPTKKTILRALGLRKGLKRESVKQIGLATENSLGYGIGYDFFIQIPIKVFEIKESSTAEYLYSALKVGDMCRKNKHAKKTKSKKVA
jgi:hypothetical protein